VKARRVLVIAFHFPPVQGSSGYLRTLKYVRHLPRFGWEPVVLTVNTRAYASTDPALLKQVPEGVKVHRSFALDASRHLAFKGRYPAFLAVPDRFATWIPFGIRDGVRLVREHGIDAVFSTYPIPSAHAVGRGVARRTGRPWLADFRDPMWDEFVGTSSSAELRARKSLEQGSLEACSHATVTTSGMKDLFHARYPHVPASRITAIPNGYDEDDFQGVERTARAPGARFSLVHAGLLDPVDRDPEPFFEGLRRALDRGLLREAEAEIRLFAPGHEGRIRDLLERRNLAGVVQVLKPVTYKESLKAMAASDVLLLFQGPSCDKQIPAKLYEYFRIGRPILALTTTSGETGRLVEACRGGKVVDPGDPEAIAASLGEFFAALRSGADLPAATPERAARLAALLDGIAATNRAGI
jgi:glycosyltransferase involved in cell wall biosynthesis